MSNHSHTTCDDSRQINVIDLRERELDMAVAMWLKIPLEATFGGGLMFNALEQKHIPHPDGAMWCYFEPSRNWLQGGKLIEQEGISIFQTKGDEEWGARITTESGEITASGCKPLEAAMRCLAKAKLGPRVSLEMPVW